MDEFVRCPQCDDDLPGEEWEQHLGTHGYFKRPEATPPKELRGVFDSGSASDEQIELRFRRDGNHSA